MLREKTIQEEEAMLFNPLQLAYLGDTVWEMLIRELLISKKINVHQMHLKCISAVNAGAQAKWLRIIQSELNEREKEIVRRGRNAHAKHNAPRNQDPGDYAAATGLEALFGFLYITGQDKRILVLFNYAMEEYEYG